MVKEILGDNKGGTVVRFRIDKILQQKIRPWHGATASGMMAELIASTAAITNGGNRMLTEEIRTKRVTKVGLSQKTDLKQQSLLDVWSQCWSNERCCRENVTYTYSESTLQLPGSSGGVRGGLGGA